MFDDPVHEWMVGHFLAAVPWAELPYSHGCSVAFVAPAHFACEWMIEHFLAAVSYSHERPVAFVAHVHIACLGVLVVFSY